MSDRTPLTEAEIRAELGIAAMLAFRTARTCGAPASSITLTADFSDGKQIAVVHRKEEDGQ